MADDKTIAPLAAYIARIGAEKLNFRRYMVKDHRGAYYTERALIRIDPDGEIHCSSKEHAPTKEEQAEIRAAFTYGVSADTFPRSVLALRRPAEEYARGLAGTVYLFHSRVEEGKVVMIQQRTTSVDGTKAFVPWTFFSDGQWRAMEPDGALPFWKPEKSRRKNRIMIHEGAKAARAADAICEDSDSDHPWARELRLYEHWGMIGGALAPHRSAYDELTREKPAEVVYLCDNDLPGRMVLQEVSRHYAGKMKGIMLDERWPVAWDIADPMPEVLFNGKGRYVGKSLAELMQPATRATRLIPQPSGKGRPITVISEVFAEEWVHSVTPDAFVHCDMPNDIMLTSEFNDVVRPYSDVEDTARLVRTTAAIKGRKLIYDPSLPPGVYHGDEGRSFNTFAPTTVREEKGSIKPWIAFMEHLFPIEGDRKEVYRWVATLVAMPEVKMSYGLLLQSTTQGVGKGTLAEKVLKPLVGHHNVSVPSENDIVDSVFNGWLTHKRLAIVHEIYAGQSAKAYNKLKSVITEGSVDVNRKYVTSYTVDNWVHVVACSNSLKALQLTIDDRRWLVPKVAEVKRPQEYWTEFNRWLSEEGGLGIILRWAKEWLTKNTPVRRSEEAPWTAAKKETIEEGYSEGMQLVAAFLSAVQDEMGEERPAPFIIDTTMVEVIRQVIYEGKRSEYLERPLTVRKVAKAAGWTESKHTVPFGIKWGQGPTQKARMLFLDPGDAEKRPEELVKEGRKPLDINGLLDRWSLKRGI